MEAQTVTTEFTTADVRVVAYGFSATGRPLDGYAYFADGRAYAWRTDAEGNIHLETRTRRGWQSLPQCVRRAAQIAAALPQATA